MEKYSNVILSNMCMVYNDKDEILVQMREKKDWSGLTFPGGHVEDNESIVDSVIREIKEETGLTIKNPKLVGVRDWIEDGTRTVSLLFTTTDFEGSLIDETEEGRVYWVKRSDLDKLDYAYGFKAQLPLFLENKWSEIFSYEENGIWKYIFY
jgi:8-oxo-dGTP diphosphatase